MLALFSESLHHELLCPSAHLLAMKWGAVPISPVHLLREFALSIVSIPCRAYLPQTRATPSNQEQKAHLHIKQQTPSLQRSNGECSGSLVLNN